MDASLDQETREKLEDLARGFRQSRAAVLRHVMRWGLARVNIGVVDPHDLHARVHAAARAVGGTVAPWLRHLMRQVEASDFPASW
jgi:hypothetical protein